LTAAIPSDTVTIVGIGLVVYIIATYVLAFWVSRRVDDVEEFLVAGRRLPLSLAWATLMATWFGAATVLTAADEVKREGLRAAALEPIGAGLCLILAGLFFARRLWNMKLLTLSDFFAVRFGRRAETLSALVMIPSYFGWIAVQFLALAGILQIFFGIDPVYGVLIVAITGTGYTFLGGMWAVTLTDAVQLVFLLLGLVVLAITVLFGLGTGPADVFGQISANARPGYLDLIPTESTHEVITWFGILAISALGNIPGQDLTQRVFAAKSASVARNACIAAGTAYIIFGAVAVFLGIVGGTIGGHDGESSVIVTLATTLLSAPLALIVVVALTSAVMSTIDSAILSPSSVMAQNLFLHWWPDGDRLKMNRAAVFIVAVTSVVVAYVGESAFGLLESAYEVGLMGLFVPLAMGLARTPRRESPAIATMGLGFAAWLLHLVLGWHSFVPPLLDQWQIQLPVSLPIVVLEVGLYLWLDRGPAPLAADSEADL